MPSVPFLPFLPSVPSLPGFPSAPFVPFSTNLVAVVHAEAGMAMDASLEMAAAHVV